MAEVSNGSIVCIGVTRTPYISGDDGKQELIKEFRALKSDFANLPKDDDMATGSSVLFLDTSEYAEYHGPTKTWYLL